MADLERFESDLTALIYLYNVDDHVGVTGADLVARKVMEFLEIIKACHAGVGDLEVNLVVAPRSVSSESVRTEPLVPPTSKIEALPATEDRCACGWSEEPHLRTQHEPLTPPCPKFVSRPGEFAAGPNSTCDTCGESGLAHGIMQLGPPTQIAETLTPLED